MEDKTQETRERRHEAADRCFCTEQAIDRVAQFLIDNGLFDDPHAAQTQATFLIAGEGCRCRKN